MRAGRSIVLLLAVLAGCAPAPPPSVATRVPGPMASVATRTPSAPSLAPTARPTAPVPTATIALPTPTPVPRPPLTDAVRMALDRHPGTIAVAVARLDGSASADLNADQRFRTASLYKLFVLTAAMAAIEAGSLDPQEVLTIGPALVAADPYADFLTGTQVTVDCALRTMIEMSGNSAADLLEDRLGLAAINAQIRALGLRQSSLAADSAFTSAHDLAELLVAIGRGEAVSTGASQRMLELLSNQQQNDRIPAPLPLNVRVAHKTGELPGLRHDAAIVFAPSGPYALVTLVQDVPDEAEARSAIIDVSRAAYSALEPGGIPLYLGLAPRLAREVFRLPDARGRMALLADPRTETVLLEPLGVDVVEGTSDVRLRPEAVPDLVALQHAAHDAGAPLWLSRGFLRPTEAEAPHALPIAWLQPCPVNQPPRTADVRVKDEPATGLQHWLGTVVSVSDAPNGTSTSADDSNTPLGHWLLDHAWEHGYVPALPEASTPGPREPWTWRWVGRAMATRLRPAIGAPDYPARARAELQRAVSELDGPQAPVWGQTGECWTIATSTGRGCASRWNFLPLPGFQGG